MDVGRVGNLIVIRRNNVAAAARSADHHCQHIYTRMNGGMWSGTLQFYIDTVMDTQYLKKEGY